MTRFARRAAMAGAAALSLAAAGCASKGGPATNGPSPSSPRAQGGVIDTTTFAPDLAVDLKQFTRVTLGMYYFDAKIGSGTVAAEGRKATIRYAAYLPSGALVEGQNQPIEVEINESMIKGLRFGLVGMRAGGQRRLVLPPSLAYGRQQYGKIPPNSILVFDVDLVAVR